MLEDRVYRSFASSCFGESNDISVLSETFSAEKEIIFTNKTNLTFASSALAAVLAEFTRMGSPEKVGHVVKLNINIYNQLD